MAGGEFRRSESRSHEFSAGGKAKRHERAALSGCAADSRRHIAATPPEPSGARNELDDSHPPAPPVTRTPCPAEIPYNSWDNLH
jgi:hypothetical protein